MILKKFNWKIIGAVVAADQLTKFLVAENFPNLVLKNPGLPFGLRLPIAETFISSQKFLELLIVATAIIFFLLISEKFAEGQHIALSLILGGALSNLADRIALGYVRDFISTGVGATNLADVAIWTGIIMLLLNIKLRHSKNHAAKNLYRRSSRLERRTD